MNFEDAMKTYPELLGFIGGCLNQDAKEIAEQEGIIFDENDLKNTLLRISNQYVNFCSQKDLKQLRDDIFRFLEKHKDNLDDIFAQTYGFEFDPMLWGISVESFLRQLDFFASQKQFQES